MRERAANSVYYLTLLPLLRTEKERSNRTRKKRECQGPKKAVYLGPSGGTDAERTEKELNILSFVGRGARFS